MVTIYQGFLNKESYRATGNCYTWYYCYCGLIIQNKDIRNKSLLIKTNHFRDYPQAMAGYAIAGLVVCNYNHSTAPKSEGVSVKVAGEAVQTCSYR